MTLAKGLQSACFCQLAIHSANVIAAAAAAVVAHAANRHPPQALGDFSPINAFLEPADICAAVQRVLAMPLQQRQQLGLQARKQYLQEKSIFVHKMRVLRKVLHRRRVERKEAQANKVVADSNGVCCGCSPPVE